MFACMALEQKYCSIKVCYASQISNNKSCKSLSALFFLSPTGPAVLPNTSRTQTTLQYYFFTAAENTALNIAQHKPACSILSSHQPSGEIPKGKLLANLRLSFKVKSWAKVKRLNNFGCTWPIKAVLAFLESGYKGRLNHTHFKTL